MEQTQPKIVGREFRFAFHIPAKTAEEKDFHFVKEQVHYEIDGKTVIKPELRLIADMERPVWFTRPNLRTHNEKREFEKEENLMKVMVRQSELKQTVARMTGNFNYHASLRELCGSPYVYGADIPSTLILRKAFYADKWPDLVTPRTVANFDSETDMLNGVEDIIITTTSFKDEMYVGFQKRFVHGHDDVLGKLGKTLEKHLKAFQEKNRENEIFKKNKDLMELLEQNPKITIYVAENEIDLIKNNFEWIHARRPDFLAIWNMNFDVKKILAACERANVDPKDILCDPKLPKEIRICKYVEGSDSKKTASGKHMPIKPANQWHTLNLTASFYVIDAMCCYRRIRGGAELTSYSLESILQRELKIGKLSIPEAEKYKKADWHRFMQKNMPFDYIAYGLFDTFTMNLLDAKTKDLSRTLSLLADFTNFEDYSSQTKRLRDNFFLFGLESLGLVVGSLGPKKKPKKEVKEVVKDPEDFMDEEELEEEEEEGKALDRRNWVITLRAYMTVLGQCVIEEDPKLQTLIRAFVYDSDVVSSYPNCTLVANVSKRTTRKEIKRIGDIPEPIFRMQNLNCIFGVTNAVEYCQTMLGMPSFEELNHMFVFQEKKIISDI